MLQLSVFVWTLRSSVWVVFNHFLLIDATDRSKISSDQNRLFFAVSTNSFSFFANNPFKLRYKELYPPPHDHIPPFPPHFLTELAGIPSPWHLSILLVFSLIIISRCRGHWEKTGLCVLSFTDHMFKLHASTAPSSQNCF